ncbi:glycosyltransferase 87 family protein [Kitasatospora sp. NPDC002227]|uniref:glycosyltransferase 87 family protein n=1 Tax=Kitasatospora sp. NPDC002227 TaxID=3154773 RepID=UPI00332BA911
MALFKQVRIQNGKAGWYAAISALVAGALVLRLAGHAFQTVDYTWFLHSWYKHLDTHGGFRALDDTSFADYNVPYLYLLAALTYLPVKALTGIKLISVAFDLLLAYYVYRIVALRHLGHRAVLAGMAALLLPSVIANGAWWAQSDSIYTAFIVGGVYYVLRQRPWWACTFFGLALAFKLQAIFIAPFVLVMLLLGRVPWRTLLAVPATYLALDLPALLLGHDPVKLFTVYARQTGTYQALTLNAPSVYQFISVTGHDDQIRRLGMLATVAAVLGLTALAVFSRTGLATMRARGAQWVLTRRRVVLLATASVLLVPFLLPSMHERYFYPADILALIAAFELPRRLWPLPLLTQLSSFGSYLLYLRHPAAPPNPMPQMAVYATATALALGLVLWALAADFRLGPQPGRTSQDSQPSQDSQQARRRPGIRRKPAVRS